MGWKKSDWEWFNSNSINSTDVVPNTIPDVRDICITNVNRIDNIISNNFGPVSKNTFENKLTGMYYTYDNDNEGESFIYIS